MGRAPRAGGLWATGSCAVGASSLGSTPAMSLSPEHRQWIIGSGYRHFVFISYPRIPESKRLADFARHLRQELDGELRQHLRALGVFHDGRLTVGDDWDAVLSRELCSSMTMVALCVPQYYDRCDGWCGYEWSTMQRLSDRRLAGRETGAILPILLKSPAFVPGAVRRAQFWDFSGPFNSTRPHAGRSFRDLVAAIEAKVLAVAEKLAQAQALPLVAGEAVVRASPFDDWHAPTPPMPALPAPALAVPA